MDGMEEDGGGWRRMEEDGGGWRRMEEDGPRAGEKWCGEEWSMMSTDKRKRKEAISHK